MGWLEKIDFRASGEADFRIIPFKIAFSVKIDLPIKDEIFLGGLNGAKDE